jgi:hypothetical protein
VKVQRLSSTDGFIVWDLDDASTSVGVVRLAPKVLQDGALLLARSTTYAFASFGVEGHGGASAAINAKPDDRDAAVTAFVQEVQPLVADGRLRLAPGLGVDAGDLAGLAVAAEAGAPGSNAAPDEVGATGAARSTDATDPVSVGDPTGAADEADPTGAPVTAWAVPDPALVAAGAVAAARVAGPLDWRMAAVVGTGPVVDATVAALEAADTRLVDGRYDAPCDLLFVAGKAGCLDHPTAEVVHARVIVPLTPVPVTARALAILGRAERIVVPDFLSTAAPLLAAADPEGTAGDPVQRIREATIELAEEGPGMWLAAALKAEDNLATWTKEKPFGRPLA